VLPDFSDPVLAANVRAIYGLGQALRRNPNVFALAGDVLADDPSFLDDIGAGLAQPGDFVVELESVMNAFLIPVEGGNSFNRASAAANPLWMAAALLDPTQADPSICQPGEAPLACEVRLVQPAYLLVAVGRNERDLLSFRQALDAVLRMASDAGVVSVLVTLPGPPEMIGPYNVMLVETARVWNLPLWNLWLDLRDLPGGGVNPDGTLTSPGPGQNAILTPDLLQFGANRANLSALRLLAALRAFLSPGS
jgi:hypothetical protein